MVKELKKASN